MRAIFTSQGHICKVLVISQHSKCWVQVFLEIIPLEAKLFWVLHAVLDISWSEEIYYRAFNQACVAFMVAVTFPSVFHRHNILVRVDLIVVFYESLPHPAIGRATHFQHVLSPNLKPHYKSSSLLSSVNKSLAKYRLSYIPFIAIKTTTRPCNDRTWVQ